MRKFLIVILSGVLVAGTMTIARMGGPGVAFSAPDPGKAPGDVRTPRGGRSRGAATRPSSGGRRGGPGSRRFGKPLTKEQEQEVLDFLKKERPDFYKKAIEEREKDPKRYQRTIRSMWHFMSRVKNLPKDLRDAYHTSQRSFVEMWRLAKELKDTQDAARKKVLDEKLRSLAEEHFDASQIIREHRLTQLADEIKRLKADLQQRAKDRKAVVRETIERMMSSAERFPGPGGPGPRGRPPHPGSRPSGPRDERPGR